MSTEIRTQLDSHPYENNTINLISTLTILCIIINSIGNLMIANFAISFIMLLAAAQLRKNSLAIDKKTSLLTAAIITFMLIINCIGKYNSNFTTPSMMRLFNYASAMFLFAFACAYRHKYSLALNIAKPTAIFSIAYLTALIASLITLPSTHDWVNNPPIFGHIRHITFVIFISAISSAWLITNNDPTKIERAIYTLSLTSSIAITLWTGGRGGALAIIIGISIILITKKSDIRKNLTLLIKSTILAIIISSLMPTNHPSMGWKNSIIRSQTNHSLNQKTSGRLDIWKYCLAKIKEEPITGFGGESFLYMYKEKNPNHKLMQIHNGPIQIAFEWGIPISLLIIGSLVAKTLESLRHIKHTNKVKTFGLAITASTLVYALFDGVLYHGTPLFLCTIGFGLMFSATTRLRNTTTT